MDPFREMTAFCAWRRESGAKTLKSLTQLARRVGRCHAYFRRPSMGLHRISIDVAEDLATAMGECGWWEHRAAELSEEAGVPKERFVQSLIRVHRQSDAA